jgi:signal transduction histidine kinase
MGDRGVLTLSGRRDRHYIWIYIKDSGHGIPESELPRLFSPYHTTKPDGIGLGLAYSKKIVEGMGGKITMSNRTDGTGAKVTITLEAAKE